MSKPWPTYKNRSSVFGRDLHFLTPEARGIERRRLTDAKVTAFKTGGHASQCLGLPGSREFMLNKGTAV